MDPLQTATLNALEPFLVLAPSATSPRAAADLISQAAAATGTFVFAELLQSPNIQALTKPDVDQQWARWYTVLELFCWGTWKEYEESSTTLPTLTAPQQTKLRLLTLLSLAHTPGQLTYRSLLSSLSLSSPRDLESLVTTAIYSGLLTAKLDPSAQIVSVSSVAPLRDLRPGGISNLLQILGAWEERCAEVLKEVEEKSVLVRTEAVARARNEDDWDTVMEEKIGVPLDADGANAAALLAAAGEGGKRKERAEGEGPAKKGGRFGGIIGRVK